MGFSPSRVICEFCYQNCFQVSSCNKIAAPHLCKRIRTMCSKQKAKLFRGLHLLERKPGYCPKTFKRGQSLLNLTLSAEPLSEFGKKKCSSHLVFTNRSYIDKCFTNSILWPPSYPTFSYALTVVLS